MYYIFLTSMDNNLKVADCKQKFGDYSTVN